MKFEATGINTIWKRDKWTKWYEKYFEIFKEECDVIKEKNILKSYCYENIIPEIFNYWVENYYSNPYDDRELMTELEVYILEHIEILTQV